MSITSANINDGKAGPEALPDNPGEVFADSAYRGNHFRDAVRANGGIPRIVATGKWGRDEQETLRKLKKWNQPIHRVRGRIEKIFGRWKIQAALAIARGDNAGGTDADLVRCAARLLGFRRVGSDLQVRLNKALAD